MVAMNFEAWLAGLLRQNESEVQNLLQDKSALHFLIAWSLFESKCFDGYLTADGIPVFAKRMEDDNFDKKLVSDTAMYFHRRYQDAALYKNLKHQRPPPKQMDALLKTEFAKLSIQDEVLLVVFTVFRFRNNMFHGNKGIGTWLNFGEQIQRCTHAMQVFVTHAERIKPSLGQK